MKIKMVNVHEYGTTPEAATEILFRLKASGQDMNIEALIPGSDKNWSPLVGLRTDSKGRLCAIRWNTAATTQSSHPLHKFLNADFGGHIKDMFQ
jgi:hypothetical protein